MNVNTDNILENPFRGAAVTLAFLLDPAVICSTHIYFRTALTKLNVQSLPACSLVKTTGDVI